MELPDPGHTRIVKSALPFQRAPAKHYVFTQQGVNWKLLKDFFSREGKLPKSYIIQLIGMAKPIFANQPNMISMNEPVTIVGDLHGQFYDLLTIFQAQLGGKPNHQQYLFLGDYVDRGAYSLQIMFLLLALKIDFPQRIYMLRGNHECRNSTTRYGFRDQCLRKYDQEIYQLFMVLFDCLPLTGLVNNRFLCVHGGISSQLLKLKDVNKIHRFAEIPTKGLFCDFMWADPSNTQSGHLNSLVKPNSTRGCSCFYGTELITQFLEKNNLTSIIRAHEVQEQGYKFYTWGPNKQPLVITIFSAPNYCDYYNNKGGIIRIKDNNVNVLRFAVKPHPYELPSRQDLFSWSLPFVAHKLTEMFSHLLKPGMKLQNQKFSEPLLVLMNRAQSVFKILSQHTKKVSYNKKLLDTDGKSLDILIAEDEQARELSKNKYNNAFEMKKKADSKNQAAFQPHRLN